MSSFQWADHQTELETAARESRPVVVLAEDNEDARHAYGLILRHSGYQVEEAADGLEAVAMIRGLRPSLVLMDIGLPGIDGFQASRMLKSDVETNTIPIIAFSARIDSTADLVCASPAFDGYILKPVSPDELVRRVEAYLALLGDRPRRRDRSRSWSDDRDSRGEGFTA